MLPHSTGGQCSLSGPSAATTRSIISGKGKATHTDDETRKSSNEDGAMESFEDGISRTNRRVSRSHWPHSHTGSGSVNSEAESARRVRRPEDFDWGHSGRRHRYIEFPRCPMDGARRRRRLTRPRTRAHLVTTSHAPAVRPTSSSHFLPNTYCTS
jgi:hypothetical protein